MVYLRVAEKGRVVLGRGSEETEKGKNEKDYVVQLRRQAFCCKKLLGMLRRRDRGPCRKC